MSKVETGLTVCLKSPQILTLTLSGFSTQTIGAAHSATSIGSRVPSATKRFNSFSTLSRKKYGTEHGLQYLGGAEGSTIMFCLKASEST